MAPRDPSKEREPSIVLAHIWQELLGAASIDPSDDFFALGGDSVLASQMIVQVKRLTGVALPVDAVFRAPTLAQLSSMFAGVRDRERPQEMEL